MPLLILLVWPILEIWLLVKAGQNFGFVNTVFALLAMAVLGAGFAKAQGSFLLGRLKTTLASGAIPTTEVLHGLLLFLGGILFLVPGFISDLIGAIFVLPGTRHLVVIWLRWQLARKIRSGAFRVFSGSDGGMGGFGRFGGFGGFGGYRGAGGPDGFTQSDSFDSADDFAPPRDVSPKVIDVTPISSTRRSDEDPNSERS